MPNPPAPDAETPPTTTGQNSTHFLDCLSALLLTHLSPPPTKPRKPTKSTRRSTIKPVSVPPPTEEETLQAADDLADFAEFLAVDIFSCLPEDLQTLCYTHIRNDAVLAEKYALPLSVGLVDDLAARLSPTTTDSLIAYNLLPLTTTTPAAFLAPLLTSYVTPLITPPPSLPSPTAPRATACELCSRDWIPLTYHHLIPRSVHAKVLKRGWHEEWRLQSVAWLCRACHSFVHKCAGNEELAREWWSVELLASREDVGRWVGWVGGVRWKSR